MGRDHDVAKEDSGINSVTLNWLQSNFSSQMGLLDGLKNAPISTDGLVFGETPPGLAHEPHWGVQVMTTRGGGKKW
jgi:hypothetical protein